MNYRTILKNIIPFGLVKSSSEQYLGRALSASAISSIFGTGGNPVNVVEEYNGFAWKCINVRATVLSAEDLYVEKLVGKKWHEDIGHQFNDVLEGDNGRRDLSELLEAHSRSMDLYGESFWYFSKGETYGKPMGIYLLDPSCVTVMVKGDVVTGYVYNKNGDRLLFDTDEILHRYIEDPKTPYRGYGPMQAAGWFVKSARYVTVFVNNFLENNAIPSGVIVAKGTVNDDDWSLFKKEWSNKYSGIDNAGKTGFVRSGDLAFVKTGLSLGDIDFEKIKNTSRDDVMVMFGVSKPMMAIFDDINRASAVTARELFAVTFTKPELKSLTRKLTKKVRSWYGLQFRVASTNPVPEDEDAKLNMYDKGVGRWFTANEARAAYGFEPITGGDTLSDSIKPTKTEGSKSFLVDKTAVRVVMKSKTQVSYYEKLSDLRSKYTDELCSIAAPMLSKQLENHIHTLNPEKSYVASNNVDADTRVLTNEIITVLLEAALAQQILTLSRIGSGDYSFDISKDWHDMVYDSLYRAVKEFMDETQRLVSETVAQGLDAGESIDQITERLRVVYSEIDNVSNEAWRLRRLARTEVIKANNAAALLTYIHEDIDKVRWINNPGACAYCRKMHKVTTKIGSTFLDQGDTLTTDDGSVTYDYENIYYPPLHPNCECYIEGVRE